MAMEYFGFFDSTQNDERVYNGADMERFACTLSPSGVRDADSLEVKSADDGLKVRIGYGSALVGGHYYALEDDGGGAVVRTLEAPVSKPRVDRIILRMNSADAVRSVALTVLKGAESDAPVAPELTRSGDIYEISLAKIAMPVGVSIITAEQIIDERADTTVCGVLQSVTPDAAYALAQEADEKAEHAQARADAAVTRADAVLNLATQARTTANTALSKATGALYWALGPMIISVSPNGWTYDSANDRYYQDFTVTGMKASMMPFASSMKIGGNFPLCGCDSAADRVRLYMTDVPLVSSIVTVYGLEERV